MTDTYTLYCEWCRDHHQPAPTREWWNRACAVPRHPPAKSNTFDIETEQREGWAYD